LTDREHIDALRAAARHARGERIAAIRSTFVGLPVARKLSRLRRQEFIMVPLEDFESIHARVAELSALVAQNALVADAMPHEGWGVPAGWKPEAAPEDKPHPLVEGQVRCSEPVCDLPADVAGENFYRCPRGHLTIHETPKEADPT
jgi:hypothetical protein